MPQVRFPSIALPVHLPFNVCVDRDTQTHRLLYISIPLAICSFAFSMTWYGLNSLAMSPAAALVTVIYDSTLLILTSKERRREGSFRRMLDPGQGTAYGLGRTHPSRQLQEGQVNDPQAAGGTPDPERSQTNTLSTLSYPTPSLTSHTSTTTPQHSLPHRFRLPSIVIAFLWITLWLVGLVFVVQSTTWGQTARELTLTVFELLFIAAQIGVLGAFGVLCAQERRALLRTVGGSNTQLIRTR